MALQVRFGLNALLHMGEFVKDPAALIAKIAEMGYGGVEIPLVAEDLSTVDTAVIRQALEKHKLGATVCAVLVPGTNLISEDPAERKKGQDRLGRMIIMGQEMGADTVAGPIYTSLGPHPKRRRTQDEWQWAVEGLTGAAGVAGGAGVTLALEPLNRFETNFLNTTADALALVREVGHPSLTVQLDTFHSNIEDKNTPKAIRLLGPHLGHVHISESDRGVPGTGQVDWEGNFAALKEIGYARWLTIESFAQGIVELCAAACIYRDIYDTADGLAQEGLAFLKKMASAD